MVYESMRSHLEQLKVNVSKGLFAIRQLRKASVKRRHYGNLPAVRHLAASFHLAT